MNESIPSVLLSIKPRYVGLISEGSKTIEVRKSVPKLDIPFKVYIYETKGIDKSRLDVFLDGAEISTYHRGCGAVVGEFICDRVYRYTTMNFRTGVDISDEDMTQMSCLTKQEVERYEEGKIYDFGISHYGVFGWHISELNMYDEPIPLDSFVRYRDTKSGIQYYDIKKAPQNYMYVKERKYV